MENFIKQNPSSSNKEFEQLLMKDLSERKFTEGEIAKGKVSKIDDKFVFVDLGLKSEGAIPVEEFKLSKELDKVKVGSEIDVLLERLENISGELVISREKARKMRTWKKMEKAFENKQEVQGQIISKCKGGFIVDVDSCLCFLPGSQIDIRPNKTVDHLMKQPQTFECVKLDKKRGNIVLSRRAIQERKRNESRDEILSKLKEGETVNGTVKSVVDWGAFLDLDGIDIGESFKISSVKLESDVVPTIQGRDFVIATLAAPTVMKEPEKPAETEAVEGEEGADGVEAAADGEKPVTEGDKKEGDDKKPAEKKPAEKK